jgi:hypothetical protein
MSKKLNTLSFIEKANIKHNNYYNYSLVNYNNAVSKVIIICPKHGEFLQQPNNHLFGQGCIKCMGTLIFYDSHFAYMQYLTTTQKIKIIILFAFHKNS